MATISYSIAVVRPEFIANTYTSGNQSNPNILVLGNGGYLIGYNDTNGADIDYAIFDSAADTTASGYFWNTADAGDFDFTLLADGRMLLAYQDDSEGGNVEFAYMDPPNFTGGSGGLDYDEPEAGRVAVAAVDDSYVLVHSVSGGDLRVRYGSSAGTADVSIGRGEAASGPDVVTLADGGFVVVWYEQRYDHPTDDFDVVGQIFNPSGTIRSVNGSTEPFLLQELGDTLYPSVAAQASGHFVVAYTDDSWSSEEGSAGVSLIRYTAAGGYFRDVHVNVGTPGVYEYDPNVTVLANDFVVVSWEAADDIYYRVFDAELNAVAINGSDAPRVMAASFEDESDPVLAAILAGQFVAAWTDFGTDGSGSHIGATVQELVRTVNASSTDTLLTGDVIKDIITGNSLANRFEGGGGKDDLRGRGGNDAYVVYAGDRITEGAGEGTADYVSAVQSYTLNFGAQVEQMWTDNGTAIDLTGNEFAQTLTGNAASNRLDGGGGTAVDRLVGRTGDDNYIIRHTGDVIVEGANEGAVDWIESAVSYTLASGVYVEEMWTIDSNATTAINLTGNSYIQYIGGNEGSNRLDGGGGNDTLAGHWGNDSYVIRSGTETIIEISGDGDADWLAAAVSYTLEPDVDVEQMWTINSSATTAINLTGNDYVELMVGNAGNNRLESGGGDVTMRGLAGNDSYLIRSGSESIVEALGGGSDWLAAAVSYTLTANAYVEQMHTISSGATTAIHLTGNAIGQSIDGNAGANTLTGNGGGDFLTGGRGRDTLWGGNDNDRYIFNAITDSGSAVASADRIMDFRDGGGQQDRIDLRLIDANTTIGSDQAFTLDTNGSFSTGEIRQTFINGGADLLLELNNDADAFSDMAIVLVGITSVRDAADFLF